LLDTYTAERHPVGAQVLRDSRAENALLRTDPQTEALREVLGDVLREPQAARTLLELSHGLRIRYGDDKNPLIGTFAVDVKLEDGRGRYIGPAGEVVAPWAERVAIEHADDGGTLIRPDGYIAWVGTDADELRAALGRWFGACAGNLHSV
jgi:hypothetical protein